MLHLFLLGFCFLCIWCNLHWLPSVALGWNSPSSCSLLCGACYLYICVSFSRCSGSLLHSSCSYIIWGIVSFLCVWGCLSQLCDEVVTCPVIAFLSQNECWKKHLGMGGIKRKVAIESIRWNEWNTCTWVLGKWNSVQLLCSSVVQWKQSLDRLFLYQNTEM